MIHICAVTAGQTRKEFQKLARRYAMTGGVEIALADNLSGEELGVIAEEWLPGLEDYPRGTSAYRSCHAYRILSLVLDSEVVEQDVKVRIQESLHQGNR